MASSRAIAIIYCICNSYCFLTDRRSEPTRTGAPDPMGGYPAGQYPPVVAHTAQGVAAGGARYPVQGYNDGGNPPANPPPKRP